MREVVLKVYKFNELSEEAKENARKWYRETFDFSVDAQCVIDHAKELLSFCGFDIDNVFYSGFWSQGDGACFTGKWSSTKIDEKTIEELQAIAPNNEELQRIGKDLLEVAKKGDLFVTITKNTHHYQHENTVSFEFEGDNENIDDENEIKELARDAMKWIYRKLQTEYDYCLSNSVIDEVFNEGEHEFYADGKIY